MRSLEGIGCCRDMVAQEVVRQDLRSSHCEQSRGTLFNISAGALGPMCPGIGNRGLPFDCHYPKHFNLSMSCECNAQSCCKRNFVRLLARAEITNSHMKQFENTDLEQTNSCQKRGHRACFSPFHRKAF